MFKGTKRMGVEMNEDRTRRTYLGDGVYAAIENGMVKLTAENGVRATDTIWMEPAVLDALADYIIKVTGGAAE
jgi:hypothetical protein